jgi:hypothetical protein
VHNLQLAHDLPAHFGLGVDADDLQGQRGSVAGGGPTNLAGHDGLGGSVLDLADGATVASAQLAQDSEVLGPQVEAELDANLERVAEVVLGHGGGGRRTGGAIESQVANVPPLHGLGLKGAFSHVDVGVVESSGGGVGVEPAGAGVGRGCRGQRG